MNPEKPMSGIHAISAPPKAPDAPPFPKPPPSSNDSFIKGREKRESAPTGSKGFWRNRLVRYGLGLLALGGLGGAYEVYQNVPAIHSTVDNLTGQGVPETFDNQTDNIKVQTGVNALPATDEQIQAIINTTLPPLEDGKLPTIRMLLPPLKSGKAIEILRSYRDNDRNPLTDRLERLERGREITFPTKGTNIPIPVIEGVSSMELFKEKGENLEDETYPWYYALKFKINGQAVPYILAILASDDPKQISPTDVIKEAPLLNAKKELALTGIKGLELSVKELQSILVTNSDNVRVSYLAVAFPPEYSRGLPTKIEFITDSASGKGLHQ